MLCVGVLEAHQRDHQGNTCGATSEQLSIAYCQQPQTKHRAYISLAWHAVLLWLTPSRPESCSAALGYVCCSSSTLVTTLQDYCGSLSEDAIRKNFTLIYELLDEVIDYGCPQSTSTEALKTFVLNEPTVVVPTVRLLCCLVVLPWCLHPC